VVDEVAYWTFMCTSIVNKQLWRRAGCANRAIVKASLTEVTARVAHELFQVVEEA